MLVSARAYARRIHVHPNTVYRWIHAGLLPAVCRQGPHRHRYLVEDTQLPPSLSPGRPGFACSPLVRDAARVHRLTRRFVTAFLQNQA